MYSQRSPLLLTFDAALHLYFVFLMLSACTCPPTPLTLLTKLLWGAISVTVATTAALEWALGGHWGVLPLCSAKEAISFPFLQEEWC